MSLAESEMSFQKRATPWSLRLLLGRISEAAARFACNFSSLVTIFCAVSNAFVAASARVPEKQGMRSSRRHHSKTSCRDYDHVQRASL